MIVSLIISIVMLIANWKIYTKMGKPGWACIVPFYNLYVIFDAMYGNGWKFLTLLIPLYDIYVAIKMCFDLAHDFSQSTAFGFGLLLISPIFELILAFGDYKFMDGKYDISGEDTVSKRVDDFTASIGKDPQALDKIRDLDDLHNKGVISDEEYEQKKADLLKRV